MGRRINIALITWLAIAAPGCEFELRVDADASASVDAEIELVDAAPLTTHILLTEVKTSNDAARREFIEIFNPTDFTVDLRNYYLADTAVYAQLPAIIAGASATLDADDFIARFPGFSHLPPRSALVIAVRTHPSFPSIGELSISAVDSTPTMDEAFPNSIASQAEIDLNNDDGEGVVLFYWDQVSDLVSDVDMYNAGYRIAPENRLANKSGLEVEGPDLDNVASTYINDSYTMPMPERSNGVNQSFQRFGGEAGAEVGTGGNGIGGHDETSEQINDTWLIAAETPGVVPELE